MSKQLTCAECGGPFDPEKVEHDLQACIDYLKAKVEEHRAVLRETLALPHPAEARVRVLEAAIRWPQRTDMACNQCGQFSSALTCHECQVRMSQMLPLTKYMFDLQRALEAAQGPEQQEAGETDEH